MSHTATLPRIDKDVFTSALAAERQQLVSSAVTKLGYRAGNPLTLLSKLLTLDIVPFRTDAVKSYMASKEHEGIRTGTRNWFLWSPLVALHLATCIALFVLCAKSKGDGSGYFFAGLVLSGVCFIHICTFFGKSNMIGTGRFKKSLWNSYHINQYEGVIPDHALNFAIQIKTAVPMAEFRVVALEHTTISVPRPVPDPDPFLVVTLGTEEYFIEQWDERDLPRMTV